MRQLVLVSLHFLLLVSAPLTAVADDLDDVLEAATNCSDTCDLRNCQSIDATQCTGTVVKDECSCCPLCMETSLEEVNTTEDSLKEVEEDDMLEGACEQFSCPRFEMCLLNIQNLPVCRCPSIVMCKAKKNNPVCSEAGVTYKNACYLKMEECSKKENIRVQYKGRCRDEARRENRKKERKEKRLRRKLQRRRQKLDSRLDSLEKPSKEDRRAQRRENKRAQRKTQKKEERQAEKQQKRAEKRAEKREQRLLRKQEFREVGEEAQGEAEEMMPQADGPMMSEEDFEDSFLNEMKRKRRTERRFKKQLEKKRQRKQMRLQRKADKKEARRAARRSKRINRQQSSDVGTG